MKIFLALFLSGICCLQVLGQSLNLDYSPFTDFSFSDEEKHEAIDCFNESLYHPSIEGKKQIKYFGNLLDIKADRLEYMIDERIITINDPVTNLLESVLDIILESNPDLPKDYYHIYSARSADCNAYNLGGGIIIVNMGLIARLNSIEELVFIVGHEVSHDYKLHVYKRMEVIAANANDKDFEKKIDDIISSKGYKKGTQIKDLIYTREFSIRANQRENEFEADSIGFVFSRNAGIDKLFSLSTMDVLDSIDYFQFDEMIPLKEVFNSPQYPFKDAWLINENGALWEMSDSLYVIDDKLKTHPDCPDRKLKLNEIDNGSTNFDYLPLNEKFYELQEVICFELIEVAVSNQNYSLALYNSLVIQGLYPDNVYLKEVINHCLYEIAFSIKEYTFSDYIPFEDESFPNGFNQLLAFLHNSGSKRLLKIQSAYQIENLDFSRESAYSRYLELQLLFTQSISKNKELIKAYYKEYKTDHLRSRLTARFIN